MNLSRIGLDLAKQVFQVHGVDRHEHVVCITQSVIRRLRGAGRAPETMRPAGASLRAASARRPPCAARAGARRPP
ncbi:hypothetical protein DZA21_00520 [Pseudomonas aeruginosa]|nr:hypothetical protein DZA21_00520 [Pseudomonas aeruginosa]